MKMTLKKLRADVAAAKNAWQVARKSKKPAAEIARLRGLYEKTLMLVEQAEADGKKDTDEIDLPKDYKSPEAAEEGAAGKGAGGSGGGEGEGEGEGEDPEPVELSELGTMIAEQVGTALDARLKTLNLKPVDADTMSTIVDAALKKHQKDSTMPDKAMLATIMTDIADQAIERAKKPSKMRFSQKDGSRKGDGGGGDSHMIEMPFALTRESMPLHMKQLYNVVAEGLNTHVKGNGKRKLRLIDITPDEEEEGTKLAENFWTALRTVGIKALTTTGTGTGAEWVPRDLSAEVFRRLYLESQIAQMMLAREIEMPTDPFDIPILTTRPKFYRNNVQNREARASTPGTGKNTLTTQKCMALVQYSYEVTEDAIIAVLPLLQRLLGEAAAESLESMIINGDSAATHMDSDITDPDDVNKSWDGWRKLALAVATLKVDFSTGGVVRANLLALKRQLGKWGRRPNDLIWVTGGLGENAFLGLDEVITADKRGSAGTTVTGTINSYLGIPIVVSEVAREDLNAAGVYDGVTTTKGSLILVRLSDWILGNRRDFMIETDKNIKSQTIDVVASFRKAFKPAETPAATSRTVAIGYNFNA